MKDESTLNHTRRECKYPYSLDSQVPQEDFFRPASKVPLGEEVIRELARSRESALIEVHLSVDHVHIVISIPRKYSTSQVVAYIKGKRPIHIARKYMGQKKLLQGISFEPEDILLRLLVVMKKRSENTSKLKNKRIVV